jgi:hypothetical protein
MPEKVLLVRAHKNKVLLRRKVELSRAGPGFDSQQGQESFHSVQTDSGAQPSSYAMGTGDSFPVNKVTGA